MSGETRVFILRVPDDPSTKDGHILAWEEKRIKYLMNWALIPLTRAIDSLIITLKNPESDISKGLLEVAEKCMDYVEIVS